MTGHDIFAAKFNSYGNKEWVKQTGPGHAIGSAVDDDGNLYVVGYTNGLLEGQPLGFNDAFLISFGIDGSKRWVRQFGSRGDDHAVGTVVFGKDIYVVGWSSTVQGLPESCFRWMKKTRSGVYGLRCSIIAGAQKWVRQNRRGRCCHHRSGGGQQRKHICNWVMPHETGREPAGIYT